MESVDILEKPKWLVRNYLTLISGPVLTLRESLLVKWLPIWWPGVSEDDSRDKV